MADSTDIPVLSESHASSIQMIPIDQVRPSPYQARKHFDVESLRGLAESLKLEGLIQPITVRPVAHRAAETGDESSKPAIDQWELVSGERRLRAAKLLGWQHIEAKIIHTISEGEAAAKGMVENLQRENLNPIEEAQGFFELNRLDPVYWTQEQIAKVAGRTRGYVTQSLGFLKLPEPVIEHVRRLTVNRSQLLEICRLTKAEDQISATEKARDLSWKDTRKLVDDMLGKNREKKSGPELEQKSEPYATFLTGLEHNPTLGIRGSWGGRLHGGRWSFWAATKDYPTPKALSLWFRHMADVLGEGNIILLPDEDENGALEGREVIRDSESVQERFMPKTKLEVEKLALEQKSLWLPSDESELIALEALGIKHGPGAVYAKIYGASSFITQKMQGLNWTDLHVSDPVLACRELVNNLRHLKEV